MQPFSVIQIFENTESNMFNIIAKNSLILKDFEYIIVDLTKEYNLLENVKNLESQGISFKYFRGKNKQINQLRKLAKYKNIALINEKTLIPKTEKLNFEEVELLGLEKQNKFLSYIKKFFGIR